LNDLAVYIHWPYCVSKCPYCDFNSHVGAHADQSVWRQAYAKEIAHYAALLPTRRISSIFFGGGTPSLMEDETVATVLDEIACHWQLAENIEVTLEANPNSVEAEKFAGFRKAGVNRLSLGVQSLRDEALKHLGRAHNAGEAQRAIALARENFPRFSFDLIYARADQTESSWEKELREALALANGHLSLYQLTIEAGTQFHTRAGRGEELTAPDDRAAQMYELTQSILTDAGMPAYEISNHAAPGMESRHNLTYWHYDDYIGIGPGAHGRYRRDDGKRFGTEDHRAPDVWLSHVAEHGHGLRVCDEIDMPTAKREALMMGLRLADGIDANKWRDKFGDAPRDFLSAEKIARLVGEGYLNDNADRLQATLAGRQRLNALLGYLAA
jgi:oxygen-independent coproporphyrinogen-3 oxidase